MLKNIIAPVQAWLLSQNRCVGCGTAIKKGVKSQIKNKTIITCKCKRVYILNDVTKKFRRALINEI